MIPLCRCHDTSFAAGPVLFKTEIPSFCLRVWEWVWARNSNQLSVNKHGATYSCIVRTLSVVATAEWLSSAVEKGSILQSSPLYFESKHIGSKLEAKEADCV